jgi:hypothetical protein
MPAGAGQTPLSLHRLLAIAIAVIRLLVRLSQAFNPGAVEHGGARVFGDGQATTRRSRA